MERRTIGILGGVIFAANCFSQDIQMSEAVAKAETLSDMSFTSKLHGTNRPSTML